MCCLHSIRSLFPLAVCCLSSDYKIILIKFHLLVCSVIPSTLGECLPSFIFYFCKTQLSECVLKALFLFPIYLSIIYPFLSILLSISICYNFVIYMILYICMYLYNYIYIIAFFTSSVLTWPVMSRPVHSDPE